MGIYELVRSKQYKTFMAYLYGWGASVVILGALFKITHWPGATIILTIGMVTEATIFFFSAFEPLHKDYNWALVYPELALGEEEEEQARKDKKDKKKAPQGTITQQLDNALEEAKIGPELLESLASGMRNLGENAKKLSGFSDASLATDNYVSNLSKAAESVRNLGASYEKTAESLGANSNAAGEYFAQVEKATSAVKNLANVYEQTVKTMNDETGYIDGVQRLSKNLSAINAAYELQLQNTQNTLNASKDLDAQMKNAATNLAQSAEFVAAYKAQVDQLTKNVSRLNDVYGNMLAAMTSK
ncbi:MAG: gliding motility protein GldL [Bacteroidales bacterium]|nr:gliding motility protein GldL [Bacteroidales bacterium]